MTAAINIIGLGLIVFIIWWFWLSRPKRQAPSAALIEIQVDNGVYTPSDIQINKNTDVTLRFVRKDPSPCAEAVRFDDFHIRRELHLNKAEEIRLNIQQSGVYRFTCDMQMYQGYLHVR